MKKNNFYIYLWFQKADPAQFVRAYGRPCKINLDPAIALAAESPQSMYGYLNTNLFHNIVHYNSLWYNMVYKELIVSYADKWL